MAKDKVRIYYDLFERRHEGDYVDFVRYEESQVRAWLPEAEAFVEYVAGFSCGRGRVIRSAAFSGGLSDLDYAAEPLSPMRSLEVLP